MPLNRVRLIEVAGAKVVREARESHPRAVLVEKTLRRGLRGGTLPIVHPVDSPWTPYGPVILTDGPSPRLAARRFSRVLTRLSTL